MEELLRLFAENEREILGIGSVALIALLGSLGVYLQIHPDSSEMGAMESFAKSKAGGWMIAIMFTSLIFGVAKYLVDQVDVVGSAVFFERAVVEHPRLKAVSGANDLWWCLVPVAGGFFSWDVGSCTGEGKK